VIEAVGHAGVDAAGDQRLPAANVVLLNWLVMPAVTRRLEPWLAQHVAPME
jgi:hypothetical protein